MCVRRTKRTLHKPPPRFYLLFCFCFNKNQWRRRGRQKGKEASTGVARTKLGGGFGKRKEVSEF